MAKISPSSVKYNVLADFEAEGPLEKPDVIGALFGQTEGLLGSDMELRELQQEGKIGRIEVDLTTEGGRTKGEIIIPSALDKTETTIIAASIETIDKIGPTDAKVTVREVEDVRGSKRDYIMNRAKELLSGIQGGALESQEMGQELKESSRIAKITSYGAEALPAGDLSGKEIIVVEGRADVVNLLKHKMNNVIGMNGTKLPAEIAKLGEEKELTLFVDGDRGGKLIAQNVCDNAKVVYIAQAPDGKEVEELPGKEILLALRRKVPAKDFLAKNGTRSARTEKAPEVEKERPKSEKKISASDKDELKKLFSEVRGRNVLVLNENLDVLRNVPVTKVPYLKFDDAVWVLLADNATGALIAGAEKLNAKYVAAKSFGKIDSTEIELISL